jgi:hypothetical protein
MVRVDEELSAELLERAGRDQAARMSLQPGHERQEWETVVAPIDHRARLLAAEGMAGEHHDDEPARGD